MNQPDPTPPPHWRPPTTSTGFERLGDEPKLKPYKLKHKDDFIDNRNRRKHIKQARVRRITMSELMQQNNDEWAELQKQLMILEEKILKGNKLLVALLTGEDSNVTRAQALEYFYQNKAIHGAPTKQ
jgi:hypothetical protein